MVLSVFNGIDGSLAARAADASFQPSSGWFRRKGSSRTSKSEVQRVERFR